MPLGVVEREERERGTRHSRKTALDPGQWVLAMVLFPLVHSPWKPLGRRKESLLPRVPLWHLS